MAIPNSKEQQFAAAPINGFSPHNRLVNFAVAAAREATTQAHLTPELLRAAACVIGTSKTDLVTIDAKWNQADENENEAEEDALVNQFWASTAASEVSRSLGCEGASLCPVAACATGLVSIIRGAELIREGVCDVVLAGSSDASLHPGLLASYRRLGVMGNAIDDRTENDAATACRPFDSTRSGFIVGEGASVLVLESMEHATTRGAVPLAEWVSGGYASDPTGLTSVDSSGELLARLIGEQLKRAALTPRDLAAVNYHGTATQMNDTTEVRAVQNVFRQHAQSHHCERLKNFAIKGSIGHLMGAAGAVETAVSVLALHHGVLPPTVNHSIPDANCGALQFSQRAQELPSGDLLKLSLGFGGHLAAGILRQVR